MKRYRQKTLYICTAAMASALYVILTWISAAVGLSSGVIQFRISEALCILAVWSSAAVPGLTLGCLISNLLTGCAIYDIIFGTLATLVGALGVRLLRHLPYLAPLPYVAANILVIPLILAFVYGSEGSLPFFFITVGIGEITCGWIGGILLFTILRRTPLVKILSATMGGAIPNK